MYIKKFWIIFFAIASLFIIGAYLLFMAENQLNSQKTQLVNLQQTINNNNKQINNLVKINTVERTLIKSYLTQPTPTPAVKYQTLYVSQPTVQSNPEPAGNSQLDQAAAQVGVSKATLACWLSTGSARGCPQ